MQRPPQIQILLGVLLVVFGLIVLVDFSLTKAVVYLVAVLVSLILVA